MELEHYQQTPGDFFVPMFFPPSFTKQKAIKKPYVVLTNKRFLNRNLKKKENAFSYMCVALFSFVNYFCALLSLLLFFFNHYFVHAFFCYLLEEGKKWSPCVSALSRSYEFFLFFFLFFKCYLEKRWNSFFFFYLPFY